MTDDEFVLLCRSYADQAARNVTPSPRVEVQLVEIFDEDPASCAEIVFVFDPNDPVVATLTAAETATTSLRTLLDNDPDVVCTDNFNEPLIYVVTVLNISKSAYDALHTPPAAAAEDAELAPQLDMPTGPLSLKLPGLPQCAPNQKTKVLTLGLDLAGKGWTATPYFTGEFADLDRARYWGQKREREYKDKGHRASTSIYYQHDTNSEALTQEVLKALDFRA